VKCFHYPSHKGQRVKQIHVSFSRSRMWPNKVRYLPFSNSDMKLYYFHTKDDKSRIFERFRVRSRLLPDLKTVNWSVTWWDSWDSCCRLSYSCRFHRFISVINSKAISVTDHGGLYGCEMSRILHALCNWPLMTVSCQPYALATLYSLRRFLVFISVRGWGNPRKRRIG
jgi:hypothetical protein